MAEAERPIDVGDETLSVVEIVVRQLAVAAMNGEPRAIERFLKLYLEAVAAVKERNPEGNSHLDFVEKRFLGRDRPLDPADREILNNAAKKAKKYENPGDLSEMLPV